MLEIRSRTWKEVYPFWLQYNDFSKDPKIRIESTRPCGEPTISKDASDASGEDLCFTIEHDMNIIACVRLLAKGYCEGVGKGVRICGLGKMAVKHEYRNKGFASVLLNFCVQKIRTLDFDVSIILWASVLHVYDKFGYIPIYKNMMIKYFKPVEKPIQFWLDSIKTIGTW